MAKNTSSSETASKSSRKTETFSNQTQSANEPLKITWDSVQEYFEATSARLRELESAFPEFNKKSDTAFKKFRTETQKELSELRNRSDRTIETIGIFAALLSFVTFEAQIFKSDLNGYTLIGLSSLLLGALLIFVFALSNAFNPAKRDSWGAYLHPLIMFPTILIIAGGLGAFFGYNKDMQEQVEIKEEISKLKENYTASSTEIAGEILELGNKTDELISEDGDTELDVFKECVKSRGLVKCL